MSADPESKTLSGIKQATHWYGDFTTLGGITQARISDNKASRNYWILVFVAGIVMTIFSLTNTFSRYFSYATTLETSEDIAIELEFPAVTVCNANKVHCEHLRDLIIKKVKNIAVHCRQRSMFFKFAEFNSCWNR